MKLGNIMSQAERIGFCNEWQDQLTGIDDPRELLRLLATWSQVQEWCIRYDFPSIDIFRQHIDAAREYNILVDSDIKLLNPRYVMSVGRSDVRLNYTDRAVAKIDARHDSVISITATDYAIVRVFLHDRAVVNIIEQSPESHVLIYQR